MITKVTIRVTPNAKRNEMLGWEEAPKVLRIKLAVPPVEGKANRELVSYLAERLHLPKSAVTLTHGEKSRLKVIAIADLPETEIMAKLQPLP